VHADEMAETVRHAVRDAQATLGAIGEARAA